MLVASLFIQRGKQLNIEMATNMFCILVLLFFPSLVLSSFISLRVPAFGPESVVFDNLGRGPYTSISDGRIIRFSRTRGQFVDFGYTAPHRSKALCDGTNNVALGIPCGRPLGLAYYKRTGEIIIADGYYGLCILGPRGGLAKQLVTEAEGVPFGFPDGTDVDQRTGVIYMSDASALYGLDEASEVVSQNDTTGRLIRYDPRTKQATVLMTGLSGGAGTAISKDGSFVLVSEYVIRRLQKYWLTGPKANSSEVILNLPGRPNKIVRTEAGDFWVATSIQTVNTNILRGYKINGDGDILEIRDFPQFNATEITEVRQHRNALYIASLYGDMIGIQWNLQSSYTAAE